MDVRDAKQYRCLHAFSQHARHAGVAARDAKKTHVLPRTTTYDHVLPRTTTYYHVLSRTTTSVVFLHLGQPPLHVGQPVPVLFY